MSKQNITLPAAAASVTPATQHKYMRVIKSMDDNMDELLLYGFIGQYGYDEEDDMEAATVVKAIKELDRKGKDFNIRINSPGGSVFHGDPIVTAIRNCKNKVHTFIDGMAASMAADIWMAGDMRHMASNSKLMIHRTSSFAFGNAQQLREAADALDKFDEAAIKTFVELSGMDEETVRSEFYDYKDHWLTAGDALAYGLIEKIDTYEKGNSEDKTYRQLLMDAAREHAGGAVDITATAAAATVEATATATEIQFNETADWREEYLTLLGRL
jgi:ATP-dependent Clp endopeptidase proteolytic subunit ClpP